MKRRILLFIFMSFLLSNTYASNWIGGTGDWSDPTNWNPAALPTTADDVTIYSGEVTVDLAGAVCKSIVLANSATLTVSSGMILSVDGAAFYGIRLNGVGVEVTNNGTINITNSARNGILSQGGLGIVNNGTITINGTTGFYHALDNRKPFHNTASGILNIDNTVTGSGILNFTGTQVFDNDGIINISLASSIGYYGIDNLAEFDNSGTINIGSSSAAVGRGGIFNEAASVSFSNTGTINIAYTGNNFPAIDNRKVFNNMGTIDIGTSVSRGIDNNTGTFTNGSSSTITIAKGSLNNIFNRGANAVFSNSGVLSLMGTSTNGQAGINSTAEFTNLATGSINIDDTQAQGVLNSGTFTNLGPLNIGVTTAVNTTGLENNGDFTNQSSIIVGGTVGFFGVRNNKNFTNNGLLQIDNVKRQALYNNHLSLAIFNNNGMIKIGLNGLCEHRGIDNNGTFNNNQNASIEIKDVSFEAIFTTDGVFSNFGSYMHIVDGSSYYAIRGTAASSSFVNKPTGQIFTGKTIEGNQFINEGTLNPGNSPGRTQIDHKYVGNVGAIFNIELGGTMPETEYDQVNFMGTDTKDITNTTLAVGLINGHVPAIGNTYDVVIGTGYTGPFVSESLPAAPAGTMWEVDYTTDPNKVTLKLIAILPVNLISFKAEKYDGSTLLHWETASEINNRGFTIERSSDGQRWTALEFIDGSGNSNRLNSYNYMDKSPLLSSNYYRLKQVDFDGKFDYSSIVMVEFDSKEKNIISLYPNPANEKIFINNVNQESYMVEISNQIGEIVMKQEVNSSIDISNLQSGIYFIKILSLTGSSLHRIIKN